MCLCIKKTNVRKVRTDFGHVVVYLLAGSHVSAALMGVHIISNSDNDYVDIVAGFLLG